MTGAFCEKSHSRISTLNISLLAQGEQKKKKKKKKNIGELWNASDGLVANTNFLAISERRPHGQMSGGLLLSQMSLKIQIRRRRLLSETNAI
jgi:hypothetical protein